jgi:hypothetical protein
MKALLCSLIGLALLTSSADAQDKKPPEKKVEKKIDPPKGKEVQKKAAELPRFAKPIDHVPDHRPPARAGGSWHWHRHHGWVLIPVAIAPRTILLPVEFVLPPVVVYYQAETPPIEVICPHCGRPLLIYR